MSAHPIPSDLQLILSDLDKSESEARELVGELTDAQVNWQPDGGKTWSIAQCLDHLAQANTVYTAALRSAVQGVDPKNVPRRGPIQPGWLARYFIRSLEPPPRLKLRAPAKIIPASHRSREEALNAFIRSHDQIRSFVDESTEVDLNRIRFKNPFVKLLRFTTGAGLMIMAAHDRRHLWQAKQVQLRILVKK